MVAILGLSGNVCFLPPVQINFGFTYRLSFGVSSRSTQKTATIQPSPVIRRSPTPPSSPDSPTPKKSRIQSPLPPPTDNEPPVKFFYDHYKEPYPIHEKCDVQEALCVQIRKTNAVVIKAQRLQREDEDINVDLPAFFLHQPWAKTCKFIKEPTSKFYVEDFYAAVEKITTGQPHLNIMSWFGFLVRSCNDPEDKIPFHRLTREDS